MSDSISEAPKSPSQKAAEWKRKKRMESLDTIAVKNNTAEDFVFYDDRLGDSPQRLLVPKAQKDIGHGKGINHLKRYLAIRYTKAMITQEINKTAEKQLKQLRKETRTLPRTERLEREKNEVVRTNDKVIFEEMAKKIWLGLVEEYGGHDIEDVMEVQPDITGNVMKDALATGLADRKYEPEAKSD